MSTYIDADGQEFFSQVASYLKLDVRQPVLDAFDWARQEHGPERRKSGELFFTHPLTVSYYLAEYYADAATLIAALLHDLAEDTSVSVEEIEKRFGREVAQIVDGLTKFDRLTAKAKLGRELSPEEVKNATLHKLFETMTADPRIGIIKIFDRLHNMRTIGAMPPHKQQEKARETLSVYAPLAYRLGMWKVKNELQQISLQILEPERYHALMLLIRADEERQKEAFGEIASQIFHTLVEAQINVAEVVPDTYDVYGLYTEWRENGGDIGRELDGSPHFVVLLKDVLSCYMALGQIHSHWRPIPGHFDDYIAIPRDNLYRSLHTTVLYRGRPIKIRLRTVTMQIESQSGILSQWLDDEGMPLWSSDVSTRVDAMFKTISQNIQTDPTEMSDGVQVVLQDVFSNQIIVYTPKGEMRELPAGATPLDFAYNIHTHLGHSCRGARVGGHEVPLTYQLKEAETVEIMRHGSDPQRSWLDEDLGYLKTGAAKAALRRWFQKLDPTVAIAQGKRLLQDELAMLGLADYSHLLVAGWFGFDNTDALYDNLGRAKILPTAVATKVLTDNWLQATPVRARGQMVASRSGEWFVIHNAGDRVLHLCRNCNPRPGDEVIGFIRSNGHVTVHTVACPRLRSNDLRLGRSLKLRWGEEGEEQSQVVVVRVRVHDRDGLLSEISDLLRDEHINITMLCSRSIQHKATIVMGIEVSSPRQLVRLLHRTQSLVNVIEVSCLNIAENEWQTTTGVRDGFCPFSSLPSLRNGAHIGK